MYCLQIPLGMFLLLYPWVTLDMYLYISRHVTSSIWNKWLVRHSCLISCFSQLKRTSNGVRRFPHVGRNLLPPLDIQILDILSAKCFILLFEVKSTLQEMAASKYGKIQDGCLHAQKPCGHVQVLGHSQESVLC